MSKRSGARGAPGRGAGPRGAVFGPRSTLVCLVIIAAVALGLFGRTLFLREVLTGGDVLAAALIFEKHAEGQLAAGHVPLWNPYVFSGMPFYDSMSWNALVYPTYWIKAALSGN